MRGTARVALLGRSCHIASAVWAIWAEGHRCNDIRCLDPFSCGDGALARGSIDAILVDQVLLSDSSFSIAPYAAVAPILEMVDLACAGCPHRGGALAARQSDPDLIWNVVSWGSDPASLRKALRATLAGERYTDPNALLRKSGASLVGPAPHWAAVLSDREREVTAAVCKDLSNAEIGELLYISPETVHTHVRNIMAKLHLHDRVLIREYVVSHESESEDSGRER
jgi:DNA-binding CsgD family transcriptional regulator